MKHLSVFLQNKPGSLEKVTAILSSEKINIRAFTLASSGEYGVLKLLVEDAVATEKILKSRGITVKLREVIVVAVPDNPGALDGLLTLFSSNGINIDDSYGFLLNGKNQAAIVLEADNIPAAKSAVKQTKFKILHETDLN